MEAITAWLKDRKNLPIVVAGTSVIVILVALVFLKITGKIGGKAGPPADMGMAGYPPSPGMPAEPGMPGGEGPPMGPGAPGMEGYPPSAGMPGAPAGPGMPGAEAPPVGPAAPGVPVAVLAKVAPMLPYRKDPFMSFSGPPKKEDALTVLLPNVSRVRLAPASVSGVTDLAAVFGIVPQPFRRMAGVLWNGRVSAILETNGETDIVRPGMELTRGGSRVRVEAIQANCIMLTTLDTGTPRTIEVPMAGSISRAGAAQAGYNPPAGPAIYPEGFDQPVM